jgi:hypothetical protein
MWTEFFWFDVCTGGTLFRTWQWILECHKWQQMSWLVELLAAYTTWSSLVDTTMCVQVAVADTREKKASSLQDRCALMGAAAALFKRALCTTCIEWTHNSDVFLQELALCATVPSWHLWSSVLEAWNILNELILFVLYSWAHRHVV